MRSKFLSQPKRFIPLFFVALALFQFAIQVTLLTKGVEHIAVGLTDDDTYYYLQTAWNVKQFGFPTFDGLNPTNGLQLLWFWFIVLLAFVTPTKTILLFATLGLAFLLNALAHLIIWRIGETLRLPALALYLSSLWLMLSLGSRVYSSGMENSLHALVFWAVIWQTLVFLLRLRRHESLNWFGFTFVLVLNVWVRLDAAIFSVILFLYCLTELAKSPKFRPLQWPTVRPILISGAVAAAGLVIQLGAFRLMGGSYLPVSSLVKRTWASWDKAVQSLTTLGTPPTLPAGLGPAALLLFIVIAWLSFNNLKRSDRLRVEMTALAGVWLCLLIGVLLHLIVTAGVGAYHLFNWYLSPAYIFWIITLSVILYTLQSILAWRGSVTLSRFALVTVCLLFVVATGQAFSQRQVVYDPLNETRHRASLWMADNLPQDAVCASWNAGQVGFFSNRTVINLDGLVNDFDYYQRVVSGPVSWQAYIRERQVDCLADYWITAPALPGFSVANRIPFNDGSQREFVVLLASSR